MKKIIFTILLTLFISGAFAQIHMNITAAQADSLVTANSGNPGFVIIDVRTANEYAGGHIQNAININYYLSNFRAELDVFDRNFIYLVYCQGGSRSPKAMDTMQVMGFNETYNLNGGINAWISAGNQVVTGATDLYNTAGQTLIYPNPAQDIVYIEGAQGGTLRLLDLTGRSVLEQEHAEGYINVGSLSDGVYILELRNSNGLTKTKLFKRASSKP